MPLVGDLSSTVLMQRFKTLGLRWRVGPFVVGARTRLPDVAREIAFLYAHYPLVDHESFVHFQLQVRAKWPLRSWIRLSVDREIDHNWFRRHLALPLFEWALHQCMFERPQQYLKLHSAVVENEGRAVILPAPPGSGKSTLCAALIHRGWRLLSDEVALIQPQDRLLVPVPRPVGLKQESIELIRHFGGGAELGPSWPGTPKGTVAHLRAPAESVRRADEKARPAWLVFPSYRAGAEARLMPLSKARSLLRAADNSFNYSVLGRVGFETLTNVVDDCECYEFVYSDLAAAVREIDALSVGARRLPLVPA